ncbi:MAG: FAD-dependent oxidoreductase [Chloroflexi bacterium]|nr:FAD-dependent oxidoreductase [Chloroflexota bacterium]
MFDYLVIGKGLMGSAAARYLSTHSPHVLLIGPDEPTNYATHGGVFSSHYDEGRITRRLARDEVWAHLADRAIQQYRVLEEASGLRFHQPVGCLTVAHTLEDSRYLRGRDTIAQLLAVNYAVLDDAAAIQHNFPFLAFPDGYQGNYEMAPAGYINPRTMIRAQLHVARQNGTTIRNDEVLSLTQSASHVTVTTQRGDSYQAERVLVATGAFANCYEILPRPLNLRIKSETIIMAQVAPEEAARLGDMPAVIYEIDSSVLRDIYLLPPIRYPDGHFYLKMGCDTAADQSLTGLDAMREWMIYGDGDVHKAELQAALEAIIPGLRAPTWFTKRCLVTYTPHGKPYIDQLTERVFVATGGNGTSAKCADTLGHLAAQLMLGEAWEPVFERAMFATG